MVLSWFSHGSLMVFSHGSLMVLFCSLSHVWFCCSLSHGSLMVCESASHVSLYIYIYIYIITSAYLEYGIGNLTIFRAFKN